MNLVMVRGIGKRFAMLDDRRTNLEYRTESLQLPRLKESW